MRITLFGSRVHFTILHCYRLLKLFVLLSAISLVISFVASFFNVPYSRNYEYDDYDGDRLKAEHGRINRAETGLGGISKMGTKDTLEGFDQASNRDDIFSRRSSGNQDQLDYISSNLEVFIQPIANENGKFYYNVKLTNTGEKLINRCCWIIYLYASKMLDCVGITTNIGLLTSVETLGMRKHGMRWKRGDDNEGEGKNPYYFDIDQSFYVSHVIGYTFKMQPTFKFKPLKPKESITVRFTGFGWSVSKSEFIPNWYVANNINQSVQPRLIKSTAGESMSFVGEFHSKSTATRFENDQFKPFTPRERYMKNAIPKVRLGPISIIPTPLVLRYDNIDSNSNNNDDDNNNIIITDDWQIIYSGNLQTEAHYFNEKLRLKTTPKEIKFASQKSFSTHNKIFLQIAGKISKQRILANLSNESRSTLLNVRQAYFLKDAYKIKAMPNHIRVNGLSPSGVFYAIVTLLNVLDIHKQQGGTKGFTTVPFYILDAPRFGHRGLMIDVSRNFQSIDALKKVIEAMVVYKMNVLHLHLSDDEGWRLEIPGLPELTKVGGHRGHDPEEVKMIMSLLGSGPLPDSNSGSGYYGLEEFREFLKFATERHVTVIPEFDMPSHSHAAIVSMRARHKANEGKFDPKKDYLLSDLKDTSVYLTGQFYSSSAINPCIKSTFRFVKHVLHSLVEIYKGVAPLKYFHLGGDEVPGDAYMGSPACQKLDSNLSKKNGFSFEGTTSHNLKNYFVEKVAHVAVKFNLSLIGWDDAFMKADGNLMSFGDLDLNKIKNGKSVVMGTTNGDDDDGGVDDDGQEIVAQYYYNAWEQGAASKPYFMANKGMKVILSPVTAFYFDSPQEPDPHDWGLHWASRYTDTRRTFYFTPGNLYNSIDYTFSGEAINKHFVCSNHPCHPLTKPENILGIEAAMWSELIRTPVRMHNMLFPRLLAVAERAWHRARWENETDDSKRMKERKKDWESFANILGQKELERLESIGISYYLPRPGAMIENDGLHVNSMFPGLKIQISKDHGATWESFDAKTSWHGNEEAGVLLSTVSFDGTRRSTPVRFRARSKVISKKAL